MAVHNFKTREELHDFWNLRRGYLYNKTYKRLHKTNCDTYRTYGPNAPSLSSNKQGFDTLEDVYSELGPLKPEGKGWQPCPECDPL